MRQAVVVLPALNEEGAVGLVVRDLLEEARRLLADGVLLRVVVVDNGSTDDTAEVARLCGAHLVVREERRGYGRAIRAGYRAVLSWRPDAVGTMDADATYRAESMGRALRLVLDGHALAVGHRQGSADGVRALGNRLLRLASRALLLPPIVDTQSGLWAFRGDLLPEALRVPGDGMEYSQALKFRLARHGAWQEFPIPYDERVGRSKLRPVRDGLRVLLGLAHLRLRGI